MTQTPMTIGFNASNSAQVAVANTELAFNVNTAAGNDRYMLLFVVIEGLADSVSMADYNGAALALIQRHTDAISNKAIEAWGLANPATGDHPVSVTIGASAQVMVGGAVVFNNVDTSDPTGAIGTGVGTSAALTVNITTDSNASWISAGGGWATAAASTGQGGSQRWEQNNNGPPLISGQQDDKAAPLLGANSMTLNFGAATNSLGLAVEIHAKP